MNDSDEPGDTDYDRCVRAAVGHSVAVLASHEEEGERPQKSEGEEYAVDPREKRPEQITQIESLVDPFSFYM
ncbi:hypothetical protein [Salinarchaeum chitinilyticum]